MRFSFARRLFALQFVAILSTTQVINPPASHSVNQPSQYFAASPYVQLGYNFKGNNLTISWLSENPETKTLTFEYKKSDASAWKTATIQKQAVNAHAELSLLSAEMTDLPAATTINYRISKDSKEIFQANIQSPPKDGDSVNFAVIGDVGQATEAESQIAGEMKAKHPSMQIIVGDIVYPCGSVRNYLHNFFPFVNQEGGKARGSTLLQSTISVPVVGNHDLTYGGGFDCRDLDLIPDSLAYFVLWKQPLNGPVGDGSHNICVPRGGFEKIANFMKAAGQAYPRMTTFSYNYGNCHVLCLDGNEYMDWTDAKLRAWVDNDLKQAKTKWKIVAFHQPGFNSDWAHREEQRMRHLSDIFERDGIDVCFAGHSHSYQRSYPLHFKEVAAPPNDREATAGYVYGTFKIDKKFDGDKNTKPDGVVYIVTGAGGAELSGGNMENEPGQWLPFTKTFSSKRHSFSFCHTDDKHFTMEQIAEDGSVIDKFTIEK